MSDGNEEAIKRALESGRDPEDIAKDLADDGLLNNSHLLGSTERLIESNGETQDVIERATETAQKLQKLLTAIIPILVLIAGSGLELGGVIDVTPVGDDEDDSGWMWEDDHQYPDPVRYGCTDYDAENYDEYAEEDDGTCYYEQEDERHLDIQNHELSLVGDNELKVEFSLEMQGDFCCDDIELVWEIEVNGYYDDGLRRVTLHSYDEEGYIDFEQYWPDMGEGNYHARVEVRWMNDMWDEETTNGVVIEEEEVPPRRGCTDDTAENYDDEAEEDDGSCTYPEPEPCEPEYYDYYVSYGDANNTTIKFTYDVDISCDETQGVTVQFLAYVNGSGHGEAPYNYTIDEFNTTYNDWDSRTVMLGNFTNGSYDIYAYLINEHGDMMKESKWFNVELKARDE